MTVLSDIVAPERLRAGDPQALAALVAVAGWPVVSYCERGDAGDDVAAAVVLAFVTFRRRAIQSGDDDFERLLLDSARDAVDEVRGDAPAGDAARAAEAAFARASPRPLSPRLATALLRALAEAAPVDGDPEQVAAAAQRSYAEAYTAAQAAPAVAGEERLGPASALLAGAAERTEPAAAPVAAPDHPPRPAQIKPPPLAVRLRAMTPAQRAVGFALAIGVVLLLASLLSGDDDDPARQATATVTAPTETVTVTRGAPSEPRAARSQVVRATPRKPVTASGARFEVVPLADAAWAQQIRREDPRRGTRWVTIAVRTRNVSRRDLVLRTLGYRLRLSNGVVLGPRVLDVAEGPARAREGRLPVGARASVHLGFEVPFEAGTMSIAFEPGGLDEPTVVAALGALNQPS